MKKHPELDQISFSFEEITAELNYRKAQNSLRGLISNIDLTAEEQVGLELEIERLTQMLDKLEQSIVQIAAFGMVGRGKSSVLNAIVGQEVFITGALHGVTRDINIADWELSPEQIANTSKNLQRLTIADDKGKQIQLIDTPGIDEVNGEAREALACDLAKRVDLILFVVSGDISQVEYSALSKLREAGKPMLL
ncbi:MAG: Era-like GTP-binding protein, partial [Cyanobacteria bacterium P01_G01_bin.19]